MDWAPWSKPGTFLKSPPIVLPSKQWLFPIYHTPKSKKAHFSEIALGASLAPLAPWSLVALSGPNEGLVQPTCVDVSRSRGAAPGLHIRCFFRHRWEPAIFVADSRDGGLTWLPARRTRLPNNNSGIAAIALASGAVVLAFNNMPDKMFREPLSVAISRDGAETCAATHHCAATIAMREVYDAHARLHDSALTLAAPPCACCHSNPLG